MHPTLGPGFYRDLAAETTQTDFFTKSFSVAATSIGQNLLAQLGHSSAVRLFRSPGRVNIIGEHTDYTEGLVLPTTTAAYTWIAARPRDDRTVNIRSLNLNDTQSFDLDQRSSDRRSGWADYVEGVAQLLEEKGVPLPGADMVIDSEIPIGGGLSSSAALEVSIAIALLDLAGVTLPADQTAILCQRAEIEYVGVKCGVMDQFAVACCQRDSAMLLDCRTLEAKHIPLPNIVGFLITDSGVRHVLPDGDYNQRAEECALATNILTKHVKNLRSLRDLTLTDLAECRTMLTETLYRRCHHVVSENQRVLDACAALRSGDAMRLGCLVNASHESLRSDYEVSCVEVDSVVEAASAIDGVLGSRMIGGGFGGCVLSVVETELIDSVRDELCRSLESKVGKRPWMHVVTAADPAGKFSTP